MIRIRKIEQDNGYVCCKDLEGNEDYFKIELGKYVKDTQVDLVYIQKDCINDILDWVNKSKRLSPVPEVGGFLLGCFSKEEGEKYKVALQKFIPSKEVAYSSPTILEFGTKALMDLDLEMDKRPHMKLVGWFHTHPGLTPFLSTTDMKLHDGFFKKPYHLAVVLDSLTTLFDTGFFSRREDGTVNNNTEIRKWIKWKNLVVSP